MVSDKLLNILRTSILQCGGRESPINGFYGGGNVASINKRNKKKILCKKINYQGNEPNHLIRLQTGGARLEEEKDTMVSPGADSSGVSGVCSSSLAWAGGAEAVCWQGAASSLLQMPRGVLVSSRCSNSHKIIVPEGTRTRLKRKS